MARTIATEEPTSLTAGDTWEWDRSLADYPSADGWSLSYILSGAHESAITITAAAGDGDVFEVRVPAATTVGYTAGRYNLVGFASKDLDRFPVYRGALEVLPDPTGVPIVPTAEKMIALLEQAMMDVAESGVVEYTVAGRGTRKITLAEARVELQYWKTELAKQRPGFSPFRRVEVGFGSVV